MSEPQTPVADSGAAKTKRLPLIILAAVGLVVGSLGGAFLAVPLFASKFGSKPAAETPKDEKGHGDAKEGKGEHGAEAQGAMYLIDNLVLNPAGTGGTRFLMVAVALELADAKHVESLKEHDAEARDHLISLFSKKTVDQLSDATQREGFRTEAIAAIAPLLPKGAVRKVFFPQFVIQ